jgi:hypothetical protein
MTNKLEARAVRAAVAILALVSAVLWIIVLPPRKPNPHPWLDPRVTPGIPTDTNSSAPPVLIGWF